MAEEQEDEIFGFNRSDTDELLRKISAGTGGGIGQHTYDATALQLAVATTGVPARVGVTLGSATVALRYLATSGSNRVITNMGETMTAYNLAGTAVAAGAYILTLRLGDVAVVVWEECPPP